jgi:MFS family permease
MAESSTALDEWKAHWPLILASLVGMSFYSVVTYSLGTFIAPLEEEFGWSRAAISLGLTIFTLTAMVGGPFIGAAIDRWGTRKVAVPGIALHAAAFAGLSLANGTLVQWYMLWSLLAVAALTTRSLLWSTAVSSVFTKGRSFALSVMLSGTAIGQMSPMLAGWLIEDYGWRQAYLLIGCGWGGLGFVLVMLFFRDAREQGRRSGIAAPVSADLPGLSVAEAVRDSRVLRIGVANIFLTLVGSGITVHLVPILGSAGLTRGDAVALAALGGIAGIGGKLAAGWVLDRVQGSLVPFSCFSLSAIGYALLLYGTGSKSTLAAAVLVMGFAGGTGLQITTYLISRYAGLRNFGKIFGTISSAMMLGTSIGPVFAGRMYDITGNYTLLLTIGIPLVLLCALCFVGLGPYPDFAERKPE